METASQQIWGHLHLRVPRQFRFNPTHGADHKPSHPIPAKPRDRSWQLHGIGKHSPEPCSSCTYGPYPPHGGQHRQSLLPSSSQEICLLFEAPWSSVQTPPRRGQWGSPVPVSKYSQSAKPRSHGWSFPSLKKERTSLVCIKLINILYK